MNQIQLRNLIINYLKQKNGKWTKNQKHEENYKK